MQTDIQGKNVVVVGMGKRTGVSLVRYLCAKKANVFAYDSRTEKELEETLRPLAGLSFRLEAGVDAPTSLGGADLILVSPGVPIDQPYLSLARAMGKKIWSELEFASQLLTVPLVAITGTNGKSTTTSLIAHLLKTWNKNVFAGGNLGVPLLEALNQNVDFAVAEVSSFQLEGVETFRPRVGVLLNLSPNHLDRHGDFKTYAALKERLFARMRAPDRAILNGDDDACRDIAERLDCPHWIFSSAKQNGADLWLDGDQIVLPGGESCSLKNFSLLGAHNRENAMAAVAATLTLGTPISVIERGLATFTALAHRLEPVDEIGGILFVNDSKSTTPESAIRAIEAFDRPVLLLAGGRSKGASYEPLVRAVKQRVKTTSLYGEAAREMSKAWGDLSHEVCGSLTQAFSRATQNAKSGDVVLLSPANSSFDQFVDFEHRGRAFVELVQRHAKGAS